MKRGVKHNTKLPIDAVFIQHLKDGWTRDQLMGRYGCKANTVTERMRKLGITKATLGTWASERAHAQKVYSGRVPRSDARRVVNSLGVSLPRLIFLHGPYEGVVT